MDQQIINVLNALCEKFGIAIDWSSQNIIPYVQNLIEKIVHYEMSTSIMWIVLAVVIIGFGIYLSVKLHKKSNSINDDYNIGSWMIRIFVCGIGIFILLKQIHDIITCFTFPETLLIQYIENLSL